MRERENKQAGDRGKAPPGTTQAIAGTLGLVGCITLAIIVLALVIGLWVDSRLNTRPLITIILMLGSIPVTLFIMFRIVLAAMAKIGGLVEADDQGQEHGE
jgi:MFS-type transporter involved in bile tolerance (Atg22 family)